MKEGTRLTALREREAATLRAGRAGSRPVLEEFQCVPKALVCQVGKEIVLRHEPRPQRRILLSMLTQKAIQTCQPIKRGVHERIAVIHGDEVVLINA